MFNTKKVISMLLCAAFFVMLLDGFAVSANASFEERSADRSEATEIDFSKANQTLKFEKGKRYIVSCKADGEGWQISQIKYKTKANSKFWKVLKENGNDKYLSAERMETTEDGKLQILVTCKSDKIFGLKVEAENEITGEKKDFSFSITVTEAKPAPVKQVVVLEPTNPMPDESDEPETPVVPPEDNPDKEPPEEELPGEPSEKPEEPKPEEPKPEEPKPEEPPKEEEPDEPTKPDPIIIDTTGWSFDAITAVYDGTEYKVEVTGLPDYVTPVYTDNTRTNAGTSTAHVSFLVPEGYATPEDMETTITIEKAPLYVITDQNIVEKDGKLKFEIPEGALPEGVNYIYKVNDILADGDYAITNPGMYIVDAEFELTEDFSEEMRQNYNTDPSSAIYNVLEHEDVTPSEYGLNFRLKLQQEKTDNPDEVRVTVSIEFDDESGRNSVLTYVPVYDKSVLTYVESERPEGMGGGIINNAGVVSAYKMTSGLLDNGVLTTFIFKVNEGADASNLPFTIKDPSGVWIAPDPSVIDKSTSYSSAIVINPDVDANQYTVMLPYPEGYQPEEGQQNDEAKQSTGEISEDISSNAVESLAEDVGTNGGEAPLFVSFIINEYCLIHHITFLINPYSIISKYIFFYIIYKFVLKGSDAKCIRASDVS